MKRPLLYPLSVEETEAQEVKSFAEVAELIQQWIWDLNPRLPGSAALRLTTTTLSCLEHNGHPGGKVMSSRKASCWIFLYHSLRNTCNKTTKCLQFPLKDKTPFMTIPIKGTHLHKCSVAQWPVYWPRLC